MFGVFKGLLKVTIDFGFSKWAISERQRGPSFVTCTKYSWDCDEEYKIRSNESFLGNFVGGNQNVFSFFR